MEAWDNKLIGLVAFYMNDGDFAYITNISVSNSHLRQKIALNLVNNCIEYIKERNISTIKLEVKRNNSRAISLYEKIGFSKTNENGDMWQMEWNSNYTGFKWNKLGLLFNPNHIKHLNWIESYAQAPATMEFENYLRIYFSCRPPRDENGLFVSYSAYVDVDKNNLFSIRDIAKKPILSLGERGCFDEFGTYPVSVIRRDCEIWAYYAGWTRCQSVPFNTQIGLAISKDEGRTFERIGRGPILSFSPLESTVISGPKIRKFGSKYYLFYIAAKQWIVVNGHPEFSSKIRVAISDDGIKWEKMNRDLIPEVLNIEESQASPDVTYSNGKYHMFFCYWDPKTFRITQKRRIGYAYSLDLMHWHREDHKAGIDVSADGFDSEMLAYPHVFSINGSTYMLYLGNDVGRNGFGIAKLEGVLQ
jgi:predicted GH43/DUF377 family glycosyl hydrolase